MLAALVCALLAFPLAARSEQLRVRHPEGTLHGFLSITTDQGQVLAAGDLIEIVRGDRVTSRLTFHFKDGSLDDETTVFTQKGVFRLISDHHIQRGPYFPTQLDMSVDVPKGTVVTKWKEKDGNEHESTDHMKLPPDLYNGLVTPIVKNLNPDAPETKVSMVVSTPKPRVVTLLMRPLGPAPFSLAGVARKGLQYEIKIELGGVVGLIAPVVGKAPPNIYMWIEGGEVPIFLKETGPLFEGGANLTINLIGPGWPEGKR
ncbi:hypothetical protein [Occallatibacter savannae]|uniref:hypothetical protein n=1 Tax=Occallatibacter savannae TaxID=1002691 RepID=UPI001EF5A356|nr:hypothetical protein [Occallatibacter savannae]